MIYVASLGPFVKKAIGDKGFQTNTQKIIELLPQHSEVSQMDAVVLGPKDMSGAKGIALNEAIQSKHSSVGIVYFYSKTTEEQMIDGDVMKVQVVKLTSEQIQEAVEKIIQGKPITQEHRAFESADAKSYLSEEEIAALLNEPEVVSEPELASMDQAASPTILEDFPTSMEASSPIVEALPEISATLEQRVTRLGGFSDFNYLKQSLNKSHMQEELVNHNTQYAEIVNMLDEMDAQVVQVFKDVTIPADRRFEKLKQIGVNRAAYKGLEGSLLVDKLASIMQAIALSAEEAVDARIQQMREALDTISSARLLHEEHDKLQQLIDTRLEVQVSLMELSKEIIEMYQAMELSVNELIHYVQDTGPSSFPYINEIMEPVKPLFIPQNMAAITNKLLTDLQQNKITFSVIDDKIKNIINLVFKLCEEDATIIAYQQKLIKLLQAQRVEDVVIVDHMIKNSLRLFVGPAETGRTATALTWSGVVSRRQNTLLLDLTGRSKLEQYGVEPISLEQFLKQRIESPFLCVAGSLEEKQDDVSAMVGELKNRLNYYAHIHVLLDASQTELISALAPSALSIHFVTDCSPRGSELLKPAVESFRELNIAQKVVLIDPPVDPIRLVRDLSLDPLLAKVIVLPRVKHIKACSLNRMKPYESKEVEEIFEIAFR